MFSEHNNSHFHFFPVIQLSVNKFFKMYAFIGGEMINFD